MRTQINSTLFLAAWVISAICSTASAQGNRSARFGFKASPNFNWVNIMESTMTNNGTALGFSYGIMGDFNIGDNESYWLSTELIITSAPAKTASPDTLYNTSALPSGAPYTNVQFDYRLQYVQIPISLKLKTNEIGNLIYWGQFGVCPSILMQNKLTTNANETFYSKGINSHSPNSNNNDPLDFTGIDNGSGTIVGRYTDDVSPLRVSLVLGAGVEIPISGKTTAVLGIRFDNGFTDLFRDGAVKGRNNYVGIQTGIFF